MKKLKTLGSILLGLACIQPSAWAEVIPFDSKQWVFSGNTKIVEHHGKAAVILGNKDKPGPPSGGNAMLKDMAFTNGTIEYDVSFGATRSFAGLRFRAQSAETFENFYMRAHQSGNPDANQYMPNMNGIASWQLYYGDQYSAPTQYTFDQWTHIKVVVSGKLADFFIGDMKTPAFTSELKLEQDTGQVGLWGLNITGPVHFANFEVTPEDKPMITGKAVPEEPAAKGSIMSWEVSNSLDGKTLDKQPSLDATLMEGLAFKALGAEKTGITNLAAQQGVEKAKDTVLAKFTVTSATEQTKKLYFGFSNKAKVYINNTLMFEGADDYSSRDYRFLGTMGYYDAVYLPLKKGDNEVVIAVTESMMKTGWGVQAKFADLDGLEIQSPNN